MVQSPALSLFPLLQARRSRVSTLPPQVDLLPKAPRLPTIRTPQRRLLVKSQATQAPPPRIPARSPARLQLKRPRAQQHLQLASIIHHLQDPAALLVRSTHQLSLRPMQSLPHLLQEAMTSVQAQLLRSQTRGRHLPSMSLRLML